MEINYPNKNGSGVLDGTDNIAIVSVQGALRVAMAGANSSLNVTTKTQLKVGAGRVVKIMVNAVPTVAGGIYDSATVGGTSASNLILTLGTTLTIGQIISLDWNFANGLVLDPGTGGVFSIQYE